MGSFKNNTRGGNKNTQDLVGAQYVHIDGSAALVTVVPVATGCRLIRVVNSTKGLSLNVRSGSRVVGTIATTSVEGPYRYGVYCDNGIQIDVGGTGSATAVFSS